MNVKSLLLATCLLLSHARATTPPSAIELSQKFDSVLATIWQVVEKKFSPAFAVLVAQDIDTAKNSFAIIAHDFVSGRFIPYKPVNEELHNLCATVVTLNKKLTTPEGIKPRHVRWLNNSIRELSRGTRTIVNQCFGPINPSQQCPINGSFRADAALLLQQNLNRILQFTAQFNKQVAPYFSIYVGTKLEKTMDSVFHRPFEFYLRNWWWTIPATAIGGVTLYKGFDTIKKYALAALGLGAVATGNTLGQTNPDPVVRPRGPERTQASTGTTTDTNSSSETGGDDEGMERRKKKKKKEPIIPELDPRLTRDGWIHDETIDPNTNQPIGFVQGPIQIATIQELVAEPQPHIEVRELQDGELARNANNPNICIRVGLPGLNQFVQGPCPYYALYHMYCLRAAHGDANQLAAMLLDRAEFNRNYDPQWIDRTGARAWIDNGEVENLILNSNYVNNPLENLRRENIAGNQQIRPNIGFICYIPNHPRQSIRAMTPGLYHRNDYPHAENTFLANILRFRNNGDPQYLIVYTSAGEDHATALIKQKVSHGEKFTNEQATELYEALQSPNTELEHGYITGNHQPYPIAFGWHRLFATAYNSHVVAVKLEWTGRPMQSPTRMTIIDSYKANDNRRARIFSWIEQLFVHQPLM